MKRDRSKTRLGKIALDFEPMIYILEIDVQTGVKQCLAGKHHPLVYTSTSYRMS